MNGDSFNLNIHVHLLKCNQLLIHISDLTVSILKVSLKNCFFILPEALVAREKSLGAMAQ